MCRRVTQPDGSIIIACSRGDHSDRKRVEHCAYCSRPAEVLCDMPADLAAPRFGRGEASGGKTCDKAVCKAHARQAGPGRHYCWQCARDEDRRAKEGAPATAPPAAPEPAAPAPAVAGPPPGVGAGTCQGCGAAVWWATSGADYKRRMPIDPAPVADGNVILVDGRAKVLTRRQLQQGGVAVPRYVSHFVTCKAPPRRRPKSVPKEDDHA